MTLINSYNEYLKKIFGCRVYKISIDAGFTCPNRDGTKALGGCIFCDDRGSSSRIHEIGTTIKDQVLNNIKVRKSRYRAEKFICYFQSFSNTYAPIDQLKKIYDDAIFAHPDIVGLSISTRSDCINEEKLSLIASYRKHLPYVSIEYGMQTIHDKTLKKLNRHEKHEDFLKALELSRKYRFEPCVHVIIGLPGETKEEQIQTAKALAKLQIKHVKIHTLIAMKNTPLSQDYLNGKWTPLSYEENISIICDFLENLPKNCIIHRISGNGHPTQVVAPLWIKTRKKEILFDVKKNLKKRKTYQGFASSLLKK